MKNNVDMMTRAEVESMQLLLNERLRGIEYEEKIKKIATASSFRSMKNGDPMFCIQIAYNSKGDGTHVLERGVTWELGFVGYCEIAGITPAKNRDSQLNRVSISHHSYPIGVSTSLNDEDFDLHYYLSMDTMDTGYDCFYTARPETWRVDLEKAYASIVLRRTQSYQRDRDMLASKKAIILDSANRIDEYINNQK
jgi:hypothetical protein